MPRPSRPAGPRRLRAAAVVVAPFVLALAVPASAATVEVTPAPGACGVVVTLTGLGDGVHTAVVGATVLSSGAGVPVVVAPVEGPVTAFPTAPAATASPTAPAPTASPTAPAPTASPGAVTPPAELTAVRTVTGDGDALVLLEASAVPDADPRVVVSVTVDGAAATTFELALPDCGPAATGEPTAAPTGTPTASPTPSPSPSVSPSSSPSPTASPRPTASPTPAPVRTAPASPVLTGTVGPVTTPALDGTPEQAPAPFDLGSGVTGSLSLTSFTATPPLAAPAAPSVPAPVIAAPEGSAAGVLPAPDGTRTPLDELLPPAPEDRGDDAVPAQLAAPELATGAAPDPLVDLAPAAFVLSASVGGMLMAGRRRTS